MQPETLRSSVRSRQDTPIPTMKSKSKPKLRSAPLRTILPPLSPPPDSPLPPTPDQDDKSRVYGCVSPSRPPRSQTSLPNLRGCHVVSPDLYNRTARHRIASPPTSFSAAVHSPPGSPTWPRSTGASPADSDPAEKHESCSSPQQISGQRSNRSPRRRRCLSPPSQESDRLLEPSYTDYPELSAWPFTSTSPRISMHSERDSVQRNDKINYKRPSRPNEVARSPLFIPSSPETSSSNLSYHADSPIGLSDDHHHALSASLLQNKSPRSLPPWPESRCQADYPVQSLRSSITSPKVGLQSQSLQNPTRSSLHPPPRLPRPSTPLPDPATHPHHQADPIFPDSIPHHSISSTTSLFSPIQFSDTFLPTEQRYTPTFPTKPQFQAHHPYLDSHNNTSTFLTAIPALPISHSHTNAVPHPYTHRAIHNLNPPIPSPTLHLFKPRPSNPSRPKRSSKSKSNNNNNNTAAITAQGATADTEHQRRAAAATFASLPWYVRRRRYMWMLATLLAVLVVTAGVLGGILWRLSHA